ncbi:hypothetical protein BCR44DRAFT_41985 [Catenaria anguillulae PL171]|uniref:Uncharacterized protein n=1 Tax=Catenaria anguillulae PL171 TaxID=765915 RepID=A0A1Y2I329_9FUNG|nr:hypothetical protein BCR44DRAFT_41985 [Catenaria anguillulae PL171]
MANLFGAMVEAGLTHSTNRWTWQPIPVEKYPKSFTCSECAAKLQDAGRAANAAAKAKSPSGKTFSIRSLFPNDDESLAARKRICSGGSASPSTGTGFNSTVGGSNSAGGSGSTNRSNASVGNSISNAGTSMSTCSVLIMALVVAAILRVA